MKGSIHRPYFASGDCDVRLVGGPPILDGGHADLYDRLAPESHKVGVLVEPPLEGLRAGADKRGCVFD